MLDVGYDTVLVLRSPCCASPMLIASTIGSLLADDEVGHRPARLLGRLRGSFGLAQRPISDFSQSIDVSGLSPRIRKLRSLIAGAILIFANPRLA